jgi:DUF1680 family protein
MKNRTICIAGITGILILIGSCTVPLEENIVDYPIKPIDFTHVKLQDGFWKSWVELATEKTIPFSFQKCEETGRIENFIVAAGIREGKFQGRFGFNDSDLFKIMEGAAYSLALKPDPEMETYLDTLIHYISGAQEEDGYLYTAWSLNANEYIDFACCTYSEDGQWKGTTGSSHEFYNVGHMYEAAVAHYQATGKRSFLEVALKNADLIYDVCMVQAKPYVPGHQEIEIGLVKLYRVSGEIKYLELAKHLLDIRADAKEGEYGQAHLPVVLQDEAVGHAVRANYMYSAMADVAALTGDSAYLAAIEKIWQNVAGKKLSVTGSVGAKHQGEAYGENYHLPNHPYNETCAAIANVYWNHRMFLLSGEAKYMDVLERALYNGVISGLSLDGTKFFYPNTLEHDGKSTFNQGVNGRSPWFDCSCCPSNLSRFIPSVAAYAYASQDEKLYVNLYMNSELNVAVGQGELQLVQETNYPWSGNIKIQFNNVKEVDAELLLRIPGWVEEDAVPSDLFVFENRASGAFTVRVNGQQLEPEIQEGYAILKGSWNKGDMVEISLPMEGRLLSANEKVRTKTNLLAVQYGPLVYCAEEIDNRVDVLDYSLGRDVLIEAAYQSDLLGGVNVLRADDLKLVPYYAWANRGPGKMKVWFK